MESWRDELYHHGIVGQKWGTKNGPPYPLDKATHNAVVKDGKIRKSKEEAKRDSIRVLESATAAAAIGGVGSMLISGMNPLAGIIGAGSSFAMTLLANSGKLSAYEIPSVTSDSANYLFEQEHQRAAQYAHEQAMRDHQTAVQQAQFWFQNNF